MHWSTKYTIPVPMQKQKVSKYWVSQFSNSFSLFVDCPYCSAKRGKGCISKTGRNIVSFKKHPAPMHHARRKIIEPVILLLSQRSNLAYDLFQLCHNDGVDYILGTNTECDECHAAPGQMCTYIKNTKTELSNHLSRIEKGNKFLNELKVWKRLIS